MASSALELLWSDLMAVSNVHPSDGIVLFSRLREAYSEPHRYYHNLSHIEHMLGLLEDAEIDSPAALWAVWYHDYVYVPGRKDNESKSANIARDDMNSMSMDAQIVEKVVRIIELTKNHASEDTDIELWSVLDADMAILGVERAHFDRYRGSIRKEFSNVPNSLYRRGRCAFLKSVLSQESIYKTKWFQTRFEAQARANINYELNELTGL